MAIDWNAVSAIAAAVALLSGFWTAWRGGRRSIINFVNYSVEGKIDNFGKNYGNYDDNVKARRTVFKNTGKHVDNFAIRIKASRILSVLISETSSVDSNDATITHDKEYVSIKIPDMPSGEKISVDIITNGFLSDYDRPIGGSSKFILMERGEFWFRRGLITTATIAASVLLFYFGPAFIQRIV
jgi:hypothetical protein